MHARADMTSAAGLQRDGRLRQRAAAAPQLWGRFPMGYLEEELER
jgi:hypothetical protein